MAYYPTEFETLAEHFGHPVEIARYGDEENYSLECTKCMMALLSFDNPGCEDEFEDEDAE